MCKTTETKTETKTETGCLYRTENATSVQRIRFDSF